MSPPTVHDAVWTSSRVIRGLLLSDSAFSEYVGGRIFPLVAPEGSPLPLAVYALQATDQTGSHMKGTGGTYTRTYEVHIHGQDYDELDEAAAAFRSRLESWRGIESDLKVRRVTIENEYDEPYDRPETGEDRRVYSRVFVVRCHSIEATTSLPTGSYGV